MKKSSSLLLKHNYGLLLPCACPNDPCVWKERRSLVEQEFDFDWDSELDSVGELLFIAQKPNYYSYPIWDYRRWIVEKNGTHEVAKKELEFTRTFLSEKGTRNYQAWSQRLWIIQKFDTRAVWLAELQFCREILDKDKFNISAWDQICHAVRGLNDHDIGEEEWRLEEAFFAKEVISAQPGNEGPWIYLRVLYAHDKESLYANPELECIYVDVLAEEADRLLEVKNPAGYNMANLEPGYNVEYSSVAHRGCVHALNLIVDLMFVGYEMNQNRKLVDAVSVLFAHYSRTTYGKADRIRQIGEGIFWMVCAVTFSLHASTIRYCHKYRGTSRFKDTHLFRTRRGPPFDMKAMDNTLLATENEETTLKKDLKWDLRRCITKDIITNDAALKELEFTTNIINKDAYNRYAWSHRQWLFQTFGGDWEDEKEVEFCRKILEKDTYNCFAWDQRITATTRCVRKIYAAKTPDMDYGDAVYQKVEAMEDCYIKRRNDEVDDVLKLIRAEPENPFPWCHISGMYRAYYGSFTSNRKVTNAILGVLADAGDCALALGLNDGIMGDGHVVVNARGLVNALNLLLDFIVSHGYEIDEEGGKDMRDVIDILCPESSLRPSHRKYRPTEKVSYILQRMDKTLPEHGLNWNNAADQMLTGLPF